jgi:phenylacetate-coenzyme A ligase PaaK-like adenylate-forming protein
VLPPSLLRRIGVRRARRGQRLMLDSRQTGRAEQALHAFLHTPLSALLERNGDPGAAAVALFHDVAATVPAYALFLREQGCDGTGIRTPGDFARVPLATKENYLRLHPLPSLCRDGRLELNDFVAVSSGSTGEPTPWPRFVTDELAIATRFEQVFHDAFRAAERRTLAVVCFALGSWVGGMYTSACCRHLAAKGYALTVVTPGNQREEIWRVVRALAPHYEQTVLLGYPPFLKDVLDGGRAAGVDWARCAVKLVMAGEVFSEEWRSLVAERGALRDPVHDTASLYGTADAGVLGNETPLSVCIRRYLSAHPDAARGLFGQARLPTLVQYDPYSRYFETHGGGDEQTLLFTGDNGVPLVRYHIADQGGIVGFDAMSRFLDQCGFDPRAALPAATPMRALPFAYVFGRTHFAVSFFGANVYPENVSVGLEQPEVCAWVTGKFVLQAREGIDDAPHLSIAVELAPGVAPDDDKRERIAQAVLAHLLRLNSEYANYAPPEYRLPRVSLHPAGDPAWFPVGVKHRYTRA